MAQVLLIEDDSTLRTQLQIFLNAKGHETEAFSQATRGFESYTDYGCDIVVLDVYLPDEKGIDVLQRMTAAFAYHPPIIIITGHGDKALAIEALRLGAFDFLEKPFTPHDLKSSIDRALAQKQLEIKSFRGLFESMGESDLTPRESEVAALAAEGLNNEEIGRRLDIGHETVKTHLQRAFRKFGVDNRVALAVRMRR